MAVPPVLSSTSAECSLQEVKGCTMAQSVWHAAKSAGCNRDVVEVHQLLPKASESREVECLGEQVTQIFGGVNVYGFDKLRVTQHLDPLLPGIHMAEPALAGVGGLGSEGLRCGVVDLEHKGPREVYPSLRAHVGESQNVHRGRPHRVYLSSC